MFIEAKLREHYYSCVSSLCDLTATFSQARLRLSLIEYQIQSNASTLQVSLSYSALKHKLIGRVVRSHGTEVSISNICTIYSWLVWKINWWLVGWFVGWLIDWLIFLIFLIYLFVIFCYFFILFIYSFIDWMIYWFIRNLTLFNYCFLIDWLIDRLMGRAILSNVYWLLKTGWLI